MKLPGRFSALLLTTVLVVGSWLLAAYDAIGFHGPQPSLRGPIRIEASSSPQPQSIC